MTSSIPHNNHFRYERKFFISDLSKHEVENIIILHPAMFSEIFHARIVNNIYFDSFNFKSYFENVDGSTEKSKVRIRWYGELLGLIEKPVLEIKLKKGLLGRKLSYPLQPFSHDGAIDTQRMSNHFLKTNLPDKIQYMLKGVEPKMMNQYRRKYFQTADKKYRVTIDTELAFYKIDQFGNSFPHKISDENSVILEMKYKSDLDDNANLISNIFPFQVTKSSKYVNGIEMFFL